MPFGHVVLSLSVGLALPVADLLSTPATIATCFAPENDCAAFAIRAIDRARHEILVGAYNLTTGSGIVEALLGAKQRGVDVRLVTTEHPDSAVPTSPSASAAAPTRPRHTIPRMPRE